MSSREILFSAAGASGPPTYIEDVFSTWLYTGTGSNQTITNGIDLAGKGGMVFAKFRTPGGNDGEIKDSARGFTEASLRPNTTDAAYGGSTSITGATSTGFTVGSWYGSGSTVATWTFRKQPKFFDVVTYTGNGTSNRSIAHNLGSAPGMIIVKNTSTTGNWGVYHRSLGATQRIYLNLTNAADSNSETWGDTNPTSTNFTIGNSGLVNTPGETYVAYLFAHNAGGFGTSGTDNVISCGSYTGNGSTTGPVVSLGYEPQYVLIKRTDSTGNWTVQDVMRAMSETGSAALYPNATFAEDPIGLYVTPIATGFTIKTTNLTWNASGGTYIYMAIRRPMKPPTSGTQVFYSGTGNGSTTVPAYVTNFPVDAGMLALTRTTPNSKALVSRLIGNQIAYMDLTSGYSNETDVAFDSSVGYMKGNWGGAGGYTQAFTWAFRRATGFMDVVCYTGTGSATTQAHNLGVAPELMIVKRRNATWDWYVYSATSGAGNAAFLNYNFNFSSDSQAWNSTSPTSTVFSIGNTAGTNASNSTYVAYLFATCAGVSKVGSYTGTGSTQTINAGLPTGARFVLIKRIDDVGNWWIWDTARGMVAGTDPRLALNSTAAETNANWVYTTTNGFQIVTTDATVNASGGSYIYLAIA